MAKVRAQGSVRAGMWGCAAIAASAAMLLASAAAAQTITNYDESPRYGATQDTSPQPKPRNFQPFTHPDTQPTVYDRFGRPRIVVTPNRKLVRDCVDGYVVEQRPSGPTVVPRLSCRWAYQ